MNKFTVMGFNAMYITVIANLDHKIDMITLYTLTDV